MIQRNQTQHSQLQPLTPDQENYPILQNNDPAIQNREDSQSSILQHKEQMKYKYLVVKLINIRSQDIGDVVVSIQDEQNKEHSQNIIMEGSELKDKVEDQQDITQCKKMSKYFHEENTIDDDEVKLITPDTYKQLQIYSMNWSSKQFFEFVLYHFVQLFQYISNLQLFFFLLGPFTGLILQFVVGISLMRNLGFYGFNGMHYFQCMLYILNVFSTVTLFCCQGNSLKIEVVTIWILMILRCAVISAKYAVFPKEKIYLYKNFVLTSDFKQKDQSIFTLIKFSYEEIYYQSYEAFKRLEFEPSQFFFNFIVKPKDEIIKQLIDFSKELSNYHYEKDTFQPKPLNFHNEYCQFYGFAIITKFIKEFESKSTSKWIIYPSLFISALISVLHIIYMGSQTEQITYEGFELFRIIIIILLITYSASLFLIFLFLGIRLLHKRYFMIVQCSHLLSVKRSENISERKLLPTINVFNPTIIKAWSMLRQVCFSYGDAYYLRIKCLFSIVLGLLFIAVLILLLFLFELLVIQPVTALYIFVWTVILMLFVVVMLLFVAEINSYFMKYKKILQDIQSIYVDMKRMQKFYFVEELIPQNFLHQRFVEYIKSRFQQNCSQITEYLEEINIAIDDALRNLDFDERNSALDFFGIPITYEILSQIAMAVGTAFGFGIQQYMQSST